MSEPTPDRLEPTGCTLVDLMVLTLGAALASSLGWYSLELNNNVLGGTKLAPAWYTAARQVIETTQKISLSLVPLILLRRMRYGGPLRPVEYLPLLTGTFLTLFELSRWPLLGLFYRSPYPPHHISVHPEAYYLWELTELAIGALAGLVVFLGRHRPPGWVRGIALAVSWQLLTTWICYFYQEWANGRLMLWSTPLHVVIGSTFLVQWPQSLVFFLPTMIALIDLVRPGQGRRTWVIWAAAAFALPMPALYEFRSLASSSLQGGLGKFDAIRLVGKVLALAASFALARWTEPAWRRFLEGDREGNGQSSR